MPVHKLENIISMYGLIIATNQTKTMALVNITVSPCILYHKVLFVSTYALVFK